MEGKTNEEDRPLVDNSAVLDNDTSPVVAEGEAESEFFEENVEACNFSW